MRLLHICSFCRLFSTKSSPYRPVDRDGGGGEGREGGEGGGRRGRERGWKRGETGKGGREGERRGRGETGKGERMEEGGDGEGRKGGREEREGGDGEGREDGRGGRREMFVNNILKSTHTMLIRTHTQLTAEVEKTRPQILCRKTHRARIEVCTGMNRISIPTNTMAILLHKDNNIRTHYNLCQLCIYIGQTDV